MTLPACAPPVAALAGMVPAAATPPFPPPPSTSAFAARRKPMPHPPPPPKPRRSLANARPPPPPFPPRPKELPRQRTASSLHRCSGTLSAARRVGGAGPASVGRRSSGNVVALANASTAAVAPALARSKTINAPALRTSHSRTSPSPPPLTSTYSLPRAHSSAHTASRCPLSACVTFPLTGSQSFTTGWASPHATSACVRAACVGEAIGQSNVLPVKR